MKLSILGTSYTFQIVPRSHDDRLTRCDGFFDKTSKKLVIANSVEDSDLDDPVAYIKKVARHEIIHAFAYESGLGENWEHQHFGQEETTIDWLAIQLPKMQRVIDQALTAIDRQFK